MISGGAATLSGPDAAVGRSGEQVKEGEPRDAIVAGTPQRSTPPTGRSLRRRRRKAGKVPFPRRRWHADLLALGALLAALALLLAYVAAQPPTVLAFGVDRYPS